MVRETKRPLDPMPPGPFVKIYGHIVKSSIWRESDATRLLWITMLAIADANGYVRSSVANLADEARLSLEACEEALRVLESPDRDDRSGVDEGRRVRRMQGGWHIQNFRAYREMRTEEQVRIAARVKKHRDTKRAQPSLLDEIEGVTGVTVTPEGEGEGEEEKKPPRRTRRVLDDVEGAFADLWRRYPARFGPNPRALALKAYKSRLRANVGHGELSDGLDRYAAYVRAIGKEGSEYVMQARTFFGPGEHWREEYSLKGLVARTTGGTPKGDPEGDRAWQSVLDMIPAWQRRQVTEAVHKALDAKVRAGLSAIGGFKRITETSAEKMHFLKADFLKAFHNPK